MTVKAPQPTGLNMLTATAIRHVDFEDLGSLEIVLEQRGWHVQYLDACTDLADIDRIDSDLMIVLGGPIGAYQEIDYPFLRQELRLIEQRLDAQRPILGICLGAQLMARALGARVYPGDRKEIGWSPLILNEQGASGFLSELNGVPVLHWHGDTFDLPNESTLLASSSVYQNQAFTWRDRALALQFHLEVTPMGLERWFVGHASEIANTPGLTVKDLRYQTKKFVDKLGVHGKQVFSHWLGSMEFCSVPE